MKMLIRKITTNTISPFMRETTWMETEIISGNIEGITQALPLWGKLLEWKQTIYS